MSVSLPLPERKGVGDVAPLLARGLAPDLTNPGDDRRPAQVLEQLDSGEIALRPDDLAGRDVQPFDEDGGERAARRQLVALDLQAFCGDISQRCRCQRPE